MSPVFIYNRICGELVVQAERKVRPSTHRPDVDNAAVGNAFFALLQEDTIQRCSPVFYF